LNSPAFRVIHRRGRDAIGISPSPQIFSGVIFSSVFEVTMLRPRRGVTGHVIPGSLLFFLLSILLPSGTAGADPYRPLSEIRISTEYTAADASRPPRKEVWAVNPEEREDLGWALRFFLNEGESGREICKVTLVPYAGGRNIIFRAQGMEERAYEDIVILSNFPAPCDVLPVEPDAGDRIYTQRRSAGGARFVARYRAVREDVAFGEALDKGWIKEGVQIQGPLTMISILDDQGHIVVKQLWSQGGDWWLYEENDVRRSWLIGSDMTH
jgi:hypothetical protein